MNPPSWRHTLAIVAISIFIFLENPSVGAGVSEILHEGSSASIGIDTAGRGQFNFSTDLALIPIPGGGVLNGTRLELRAGTGGAQKDSNIDYARVGLLNWPHLHLLGLERDRDFGAPLKLELGGLYVPAVIEGHAGNPNWAIFHFGGSLDYTWISRQLGGVFDGSGPEVVGECRIDTQNQLVDRLQLRTVLDVAYRAMLATRRNSGTIIKHALSASGKVGLYYDLTPTEPFRIVTRTNPASGKKTTRKITNEGRRFRLMIMELSGTYAPVNSMSLFNGIGVVRTGVDYAF